MKPIGLTVKHIEENPFTGRISGELMIIHECLGCGAISINRIAGDDDPYIILSLIDASISLGSKSELSRLGIDIVTEENRKFVEDMLFGYVHDRV